MQEVLTLEIWTKYIYYELTKTCRTQKVHQLTQCTDMDPFNKQGKQTKKSKLYITLSDFDMFSLSSYTFNFFFHFRPLTSVQIILLNPKR